MSAAIKSLGFFILAPGMVAGVIPLEFLQTGPRSDLGFFAYLALPFWIFGLIVLLWCFGDFLVNGRGTPAPVDPPKHLVVGGLYRYVRNPMYVGVLMVILGHFLWFGFWSLLIYAVVVFTAFSVFVFFYEEPHLRKTFGTAYEEYCKQIPRWIPRVRLG